MAKFSANLGFLWTELSLPEAIHAAKGAGFEAVECHFPFEVPASEVKGALDATGLPMLGLNTVRGNVEEGEFGLAAVPGAETRARAAIDQAVDYAAAIGARNVHVMAGRHGAHEVFVENLTYAAERAAPLGIGLLIEPINQRDAPDYFLSNVEQAAQIIGELGKTNISIMFDFYHVQIMQGDLLRRLETHLPLVGHIQIASVPHRNEPDRGEVDFRWLMGALDDLGYKGHVGAEYVPADTTDAGLGWLRALSSMR
ncbi:MAG: TIM barrel protein [Pseudomonadota bacterium]